MTFTKNSILVKTWVSLVVSGEFTREQIPKLFNIKTVVTEIIDGLTRE